MNVKRNAMIALALAAAAGLVGFLVATVAVEPVGNFDPSKGPASVVEVENKAYVVSTVYAYPAEVQAARKACFQGEREARGIPAGTAYVAWYEANRGTDAGNAWDAAYQGCKDANDISGAKWSAEWYSNLVRR